MGKILKTFLGLGWLVIVFTYYYQNHGYYNTQFKGIDTWFPLILGLTLAYVFFRMWAWAKEKKTVDFHFTGVRILGIMFLSLFLLGNVVFMTHKPIMYLGPPAMTYSDGSAILNPTPEELKGANFILRYGTSFNDNADLLNTADPQIRPYFSKASFTQIQTGLAWTYFKVFGFSLGLILIAYIFGHLLHKFMRKKEAEHSFETGALETVLGLGLITTILFLTGLIGLYKLPFILAAFAAILILAYKQVFEILKRLWNWEIIVEVKTRSILIPLFIFIGLVFSVHAFHNLSPLPRGWDGLNRYVVMARDLVDAGHLINRRTLYGWELVMGLAYMFDVKTSLFMTSLPGFLSFVLVWLVARRYSSNKGTALAIAAMSVMPFMNFHLSMDNKIDVAHWLFGTASLLAFLKSLDENQKIEKKSYIWMAALFAGYAFTIKFTALFSIFSLLSVIVFVQGGTIAFIGAVFISIGALALDQQIGLGSQLTLREGDALLASAISILFGACFLGYSVLKKQLTGKTFKILGLTTLFVSLPILPWIIRNGVLSKSFGLNSLLMGPWDYLDVKFDLDRSLCSSTGTFEEYDRYIGYSDNPILQFIEMPWHLTMNDVGAIGGYVDIGFLFLGLFFLGVLFYKPNKKNMVLLLFTIIYGLLWTLKATGVIWYGFVLFTLGAVYLAAIFDDFSKETLGKITLFIVIPLWLLTGLDQRLVNFGRVPLILSHTSAITYDDVRESIFPYSNELVDILRQDPGYVYKIGTSMGYFIPGYLNRAYEDQLLDNFNCIYKNFDGDLPAIRHHLLDKGFRYILYDQNTVNVGLDPEKTLETKINNFIRFIDDQLAVLIEDDIQGHHLLLLPTDAELATKPHDRGIIQPAVENDSE